MEFLPLSRKRSSARNVPSYEEQGETDVFAGSQLESLLHLGQNVITLRPLLQLGLFITFRPSTIVNVWPPNISILRGR